MNSDNNNQVDAKEARELMLTEKRKRLYAAFDLESRSNLANIRKLKRLHKAIKLIDEKLGKGVKS